MDEALDWFWGVLQGDFNEDPSLSQTIVSSIITAIPIIDQIADVRDIIANLHQLSKDSSDVWKWVALAITLIGLIPVVGSLLKGVFKTLVQFLRRGSRHLDEALETILAMVRGAGHGDPVRWLRSLPMDQYARQAGARFQQVTQSIVNGIYDVRHRWLVRRFGGNLSARLGLVEAQIKRLQAMGREKIPDSMRFLKRELDKLLDRAQPARTSGASNTSNALRHSSKPLLRLDYEVAVRRRVGGLVDRMRAAGRSDADIARAAHQERRAIGAEVKDRTDPELRDIIYRRNTQKYGDPLGPSYDYLKRERVVVDPATGQRKTIPGKTDAQIIEGSQRTGGDDFPWDEVLEYSRAKSAGDTARARALLQRINTIVNGGG